MNIDQLRIKLLEEKEILQSDSTPEVQETQENPIDTYIVSVMKSYQDANRWLDIIKEDLLINKGLVFFSEYVHNLAHTMPVRFDKFGDILHTMNILVPYPPTEDIPYTLNDISEVFSALFNTLSKISTSLYEFKKSAEENSYPSLACRTDELLIDIDSEYENLHRMQRVYDICQDSIRFDRWLTTYLKR